MQHGIYLLRRVRHWVSQQCAQLSECGRPASRAFESDVHTHHHHRRLWRADAHQRPRCEDVESEVREAIYGWQSGTVGRRETVMRAAAEPAPREPVAEPV